MTGEFVPNWRNTDPESSEVAGTAIEKSGAAQIQRTRALLLVKKHPGHTSKELAELGGMDRHAIARRLPELLRADLVQRTKDGECRWYPAEKSPTAKVLYHDIFQCSTLCSECNDSYWTRNGKCRCGSDRSEQVERERNPEICGYQPHGRGGGSRGKMWDPKKHRYVY